MSTSLSGNTQSEGLEIRGGTVDTQGGDLFGGNQFRGPTVLVAPGSAKAAAPGDKSPEMLVSLLREQLKEKYNQLEKLIQENKELNHKIDVIESVFGYVKVSIGEHNLSVNDYIMFTTVLILQNNLRVAFWDNVPENVREVGKKNA